MTQRRVILVGHTGLDPALRQASDLDLVQVTHPLDAIGEVAATERAPEPDAPGAVVIVGDAPPAEAEDFASSLRLIDPAVRIYALDDTPAYDGMVDGQDPVRMIRNGRLLTARPEAPSTDDTPRDDTPRDEDPEPGIEGPPAPLAFDPIDGPFEDEPTPVESPEIRVAESQTPEIHVPEIHVPEIQPPDIKIPEVTVPATPIPDVTGNGVHPSAPAAVVGPLDDRDVVSTMLRGGDVIATALRVLRERLADPTIRFDEDRDASGGVPVGVEAITFGVLRADGTDDESLGACAPWLSAWIRLTKQQADLREAAFTDALTGAHNRRYFERFLERVLDESRRHRHHLTLLVFDIDNFKTYNDAYGHGAGDEILCEIVRLMQSCIRPSDRVCRIGGDEFAVIFHEPDGPRQIGSSHPDSITTIASRFQAALAQHRFPKLTREAPGALTISGGLATFPWDGRTWRELLECADERAMESKRQGKNAITIG
ncbi:MAG: diguanylate cyclase [Phycisphaerales bacterium]|nr:diguanylate cyclase [Phycisphaerales bacterium]